MKQKTYEFVLRAESPIAHHQETIGNVQVVMRKSVRLPDGSFVKAPHVTGDTMRHGLREAGTWALLDAAGLDSAQLTESALRLLFAGGMVTGAGGGAAVKLSEWRRVLELVPTLALLGGCVQNRIQPGLLRVDDATLVCTETKHLLPAWALEVAGPLAESRAHLEEAMRVRMDPSLDPHKQRLLEPAARDAITERMEASEAASERGDAAGKDRTKSTTLPRSFGRVAQGSHFYWTVSADLYDDLQEDTLLVMLAAFLRRAVVGGKRGTGHGLLKAVAARQVDLAPWSDRADTLALDNRRIGERFRGHVRDRAEDLADFLSEVRA